MDMHTTTQFRDIADHHDDIVSFERVAGRKADVSEVKPVPTACGDGWYHEAAVATAEQDAVDARSNPYHH